MLIHKELKVAKDTQGPFRGLWFFIWIALLLGGMPHFVWGGTPAPEKEPAEAELNDADRDALHALFDKLGEAFLRGDAGVAGGLLAPSADKARIVETLQREFAEAQYIDFRAEQLLPDEKFSNTRYSIDVTLRYRLLYLNDSRPPDARKPVENRICHNFIVERAPGESFKILNSSFFDNMGRRSGGMRMYLNLFLYGIGILILMVLWLWGGVDAWSLRPRNTFWRWATVVPVIGSVAFLIAKRRLKRRR